MSSEASRIGDQCKDCRMIFPSFEQIQPPLTTAGATPRVSTRARPRGLAGGRARSAFRLELRGGRALSPRGRCALGPWVSGFGRSAGSANAHPPRRRSVAMCRRSPGSSGTRRFSRRRNAMTAAELRRGHRVGLREFLTLSRSRWLSGVLPEVPVAVCKAFAKMAVSIMPKEELESFEDTIEWVANPDHEFDVSLMGGLGGYLHHIPAFSPIPWAARAKDRRRGADALHGLLPRHVGRRRRGPRASLRRETKTSTPLPSFCRGSVPRRRSATSAARPPAFRSRCRPPSLNGRWPRR